MKSTGALLTLTSLFVLSACGSRFEAPDVVRDLTGAELKPAAKVEMPAEVKYPAAIVFEGGKGDPWQDPENKKHTPTWRLYICLKNTKEPVSGQTELDLAALGSPLEMKVSNAETKEHLYTNRLNKVVIKYTYTTELIRPEDNFGFSYGSAVLKSESKESWESFDKDGKSKPAPTDGWRTEDFFTPELTGGLGGEFGTLGLVVNGEQGYISRSLMTFRFTKGEVLQMIDVCEKADKPTVFQTGTELTPKP